MKSPLKSIPFSFGMSIVLLAGLGVTSHFNTSAVFDAFESNGILRTRAIAMRDLSLQFEQSEDLFHMYLLTGESSYYHDYTQSTEALPAALQAFSDAAAGRLELKIAGDHFVEMLREQLAAMNTMAKLKHAGNDAAVRTMLRSERYRTLQKGLTSQNQLLITTFRSASMAQNTLAEDAVRKADHLTLLMTVSGILSLSAAVYLVLADRRKRERMRLDLLAALDEVRLSGNAKAEFLARMSHEIRTPLNGVLGMATLIKDTELNDEQRQMLDVITGSGRALLHVIDDILDFSKIDAGKIELENVAFALPDSLHGWLAIVRQRCAEKDQKLLVEIDDSVPRAIRGDPGRTGQVVLNLLSNANKFTPEGGTIKLSARLNGAQVRIEVHDSGIGITEEAQSRLFIPFAQGDSSTSRKFGGTGLGLVIAHRLVQAMGGEMGLQSKAGEGSTFWFELPCVAAEEEDAQPAWSASTATFARPPQARRRILVAEDDAVSRAVVAKQLETLGFACDVVTNGKEAVDALANRHYGMVLMDCQMPEMDGFAATRAIRVNERETHTGRIPIIALTANAIVGEQEKCTEAGMDGFLTKPLDRRHLADAIRRFQDGRSS